jgi:hypothetical protein
MGLELPVWGIPILLDDPAGQVRERGHVPVRVLMRVQPALVFHPQADDLIDVARVRIHLERHLVRTVSLDAPRRALPAGQRLERGALVACQGFRVSMI